MELNEICFFAFRSNGFGEHWELLIRRIGRNFFNLLREPVKCRCKDSQRWREWMECRSFKFIATIDRRIVCRLHTLVSINWICRLMKLIRNLSICFCSPFPNALKDSVLLKKFYRIFWNIPNRSEGFRIIFLSNFDSKKISWFFFIRKRERNENTGSSFFSYKISTGNFSFFIY